eukprot:2671405-Rhodomonas_salina.1
MEQGGLSRGRQARRFCQVLVWFGGAEPSPGSTNGGMRRHESTGHRGPVVEGREGCGTKCLTTFEVVKQPRVDGRLQDVASVQAEFGIPHPLRGTLTHIAEPETLDKVAETRGYLDGRLDGVVGKDYFTANLCPWPLDYRAKELTVTSAVVDYRKPLLDTLSPLLDTGPLAFTRPDSE